MPKPQSHTLGQRIDAVLEPLYTEAQQHRATIELIKEQQQKLQEQVFAAEQGLGLIESRMAEVLREMAQEEPVIAAVVGASPQTIETAKASDNADTTGAAEVIEAAIPAEPKPKPKPEPAEQVAAEAQAQPPPPIEAPAPPVAQVNAEPEPAPVAEAPADSDEVDMPEIELDPEADAEAVGEAASLLEGPPAPAEEAPKVDLAAAAERAAAAAKQLREKAAAE